MLLISQTSLRWKTKHYELAMDQKKDWIQTNDSEGVIYLFKSYSNLNGSISDVDFCNTCWWTQVQKVTSWVPTQKWKCAEPRKSFKFWFLFVSMFKAVDCLIHLTAHNWQKWKSTFLTCHCHKISRVETVGLNKSNYCFKITIFVSMWNLGQFREILIFCQ